MAFLSIHRWLGLACFLSVVDAQDRPYPELTRTMTVVNRGAERWHAEAKTAEQSLNLYEEDPVASMAIREQQWRQMQAYIVALDKAAPSSGSFPTNFPDVSQAQDEERRVLRKRIGYPPPGFTTTGKERLEKMGTDALADYYRCYIPVTPEMEVYGLYIVPKHAIFPAPLVIAQHGGGGFPELALFKGGGNYHDLVRGPLRHGWIVFAPHHIFYPYGDRDYGTPLPKDVREQLDGQLRDRGTSLAAVEVAKISRSLDILLKRPEVDAQRVGMVGLSYGGYYTLYTAALEPRIRVAVPSCSFVNWGSVTNMEAGVREIRNGGKLSDLTPAELAGLICPRPLQAQAGIKDTLLTIDKARPQAEAAAEHYEKAGAANCFDFEAFEGGHEFRGDLAWSFLQRHFER